jgi:aspartate kinase
MGTLTNELRAMFTTKSVNPKMLDFLWATGELQSVALVGNYLIHKGIRADCFTGGQAGIVTSYDFGDASIRNINTENIMNSLKVHDVAIVAGFQGLTERGLYEDSTKKEITTLGRNGSDTTAFHLTHYFKAKSCILYKDVDGVFDRKPEEKDAAMYKTLHYHDVLNGVVSGVIHEKALRFCAKMFAENRDLEIIVRNFDQSRRHFTKIGRDSTKFYSG